ncbi:hypothetical protein HBB16_19850, partial [Pseudonocardia sp. MCCB 268]|nr:hypothetical protein [Pseudonocardia cytotoxica]
MTRRRTRRLVRHHGRSLRRGGPSAAAGRGSAAGAARRRRADPDGADAEECAAGVHRDHRGTPPCCAPSARDPGGARRAPTRPPATPAAGAVDLFVVVCLTLAQYVTERKHT